jgi:hypothetical protein
MTTEPTEMNVATADFDHWPVLPLSKGHFRAWAVQKGEDVTGIPYTYHACPITNALRELHGWTAPKTDYNLDLGLGWVIHDETVYRLPEWAYDLCLTVDRSRARPTGTQVAAWVSQ